MVWCYLYSGTDVGVAEYTYTSGWGSSVPVVDDAGGDWTVDHVGIFVLDNIPCCSPYTRPRHISLDQSVC